MRKKKPSNLNKETNMLILAASQKQPKAEAGPQNKWKT